MSYILDALKKADAQRERDPARGIHAQAAILPTSSHTGDGRNWLWVAAAAVLVALGWALWSMYEEKPPAAPPAVVRSEPAPGPVAVAPPAAAAISAPVAAAPATVASSQPVATAVLPPPAAPRIEPAEPRSSAQPAARGRPQLNAPPRAATVAAPEPATARAPAAPVAAPAAATAAPAAPPTTAAAAPAAAAPAGEAGAITRGLPPDAPKMAISGGVYSKNPAQRMLIVNGQVVNQGADLGSGVVLEEIRPKAAVLRFNGARYSVGF